ncbi:PTS sugar transporter subunit IIA [Olsenella sp. An290]|uniref:PTS sugar transporter subunit IIA n=1 Tax=Olsenella sp. An290 TaxID=1965625 RepID=UPI000B394D13|nr:PTS sugar transporter subunit IIA [Olsenella sp. An290]OUO34662.1 PTS fructose transporter subunit IIA [Olsenella sp. An290]
MSDFVRAENVFVKQSIGTREEVLRFICDKAAELGAVDDADTAYEAFLAREAMGETGMTDGFAVPHAKSAAIRDAIVIVVKNDRPIEWPSFDEKPVDVAIALLVPDSDVASTHIKLLSKTAVLLMRDEFKNLVHGTDDPQAIADAINAGLNED